MGLRRRPLPPIEAIYVDELSVHEPGLDAHLRPEPEPPPPLPAAPPVEVVTLETVQALVKSIVDARPVPVAEPSPRAEIAELSAQVRTLAEEVVQLAERLSERSAANAVVARPMPTDNLLVLPQSFAPASAGDDDDDPFSWPTEDELARFSDYERRDTP